MVDLSVWVEFEYCQTQVLPWAVTMVDLSIWVKIGYCWDVSVTMGRYHGGS